MSGEIPILVARVHDLWFALPLIVSVSLVYGATRHEAMPEILGHAGRFGLWVTGFMIVILAVLMLINWLL